MLWLDNYEIKNLFRSNESTRYMVIVGGVLTVSLAYGVYRQFVTKRKKKSYPPDLAIIHGAGRGPFCPSLSPFVLKIETYFRMNNIPYLAARDLTLSSKGKIPWVEYNGEVIEDSSFIIEYFNKKLSIDMNKKLTPRQRGLSRAIQKMLEENTLWCMALCRWVYGYTDNQWIGIGWIIPKFVARGVKKNAWAAGIGRHSQEEVLQIFENDIQTLSDILGKEKFIMGDEPTEVDCSLFGFASQILWQSPGLPCEKWIEEKYPNIKDYCLRMKDLYWVDWDDCITHGGTREAIR